MIKLFILTMNHALFVSFNKTTNLVSPKIVLKLNCELAQNDKLERRPKQTIQNRNKIKENTKKTL